MVSGAQLSAPDQPQRGTENIIARSSILWGRGSKGTTGFSLAVRLAALTGPAPQDEAYINYKCVLEGRPSLPRPFFFSSSTYTAVGKRHVVA
jgi:hypothetical protein